VYGVRVRGWTQAATLGTALTIAATATADPQGTVGITVGAAGRGYGDDYFSEPAIELGARGDILFGRSGPSDFGVGPYVEVVTLGFDELQLGGGASLLWPIIDSAPLVTSVGPYLRAEGLWGVEPGIASSIFWGSRSYNYSAGYVIALGVIAEARFGLGSSRESSFVLGLQLDTAFLASPLIFLIDALRGGSPETDRVPGR